MYLDRQRYTVFCPYTICRPNTKIKINRTSGQTDRLSVFFFLHVAIRNSLRSNNKRKQTKRQNDNPKGQQRNRRAEERKQRNAARSRKSQEVKKPVVFTKEPALRGREGSQRDRDWSFSTAVESVISTRFWGIIS